MKRLTLAAFAAVIGICTAGCGEVISETGETLVISQAEEDIIGDIVVDVTEDESDSATTQVKVTAGSLNMREEASASAALVTTLKEGDMAEYLGEQDGWYYIRAEVDGEDELGYISANYAELIEPEETEGSAGSEAGGDSEENTDSEESYEVLGKVEVTVKSLKVRSEASTDSTALGSLKSGDIVDCIGMEDDWYQVLVEIDGEETVGYISSDFAQIAE